MNRIALATSVRHPELPADERLILPHLKALGIQAEPQIWDAPNVRWNEFEAVVIRATWDYHHKAGQFLSWVEQLEGLGVPVYNPAQVLKWNLDKRYLKELERGAFPVIPTMWVDYESTSELFAQIKAKSWTKVVIKPTLSASADNTFLVDMHSDVPVHFPFLKGCSLMVQPYISEVEQEGEWSFVFLGGQYSHTVLKQPKAGDFRVQEEHGGSTLAKPAPPKGLILADRIVRSVGCSLLYARVDMVRIEEEFFLMELELLEPSLYLSHCAEGPQKFAAAIAHALLEN